MKIAVVAQGAMGAGTGAMLRQHGADVITSLTGRSAASVKRAAAAGMQHAADAQLAEADVILSIVPPAEALAFAQRMAPHMAAAAKKPLFADCNAVSPDSARGVASVVEASGARFVDGAIIGGPPRVGAAGPAFYASGEAAAEMAALEAFGLDIRILKAPVGAASALKMSYGGITKGCTAIGSAMMLAASRAGAAQALRDELAQSQPALTAWFGRQIPGMYAKAYRWVAEMDEVAHFAGGDARTAALYAAIAKFYEQMAEDEAGPARDVQALKDFLAIPPQAQAKPAPLGYQKMLESALKNIATLSPDEAKAMHGRKDVVFVDLRDPRELDREGRMPGAVHCPRGMLEFWIDPQSPYAKPVFQQDKQFVFFCAGGWRSALAADTAQKMGLSRVAHMGEGFKGWKAAGGPVESDEGGG